MDEAGDTRGDALHGHDDVLRASGDRLWGYMDALLREMLRPEMLEALLSGVAGTRPHPDAAAGPDPYRVLGLEKTASDADVKGRYRELLRRLHPDTAGVEGTGFLLQTVLAAYKRIGQERGWR